MRTLFEHVFQIWEFNEKRPLKVSKIKASYVSDSLVLLKDSKQLLGLIRTFQCAKNITTAIFSINCIEPICSYIK